MAALQHQIKAKKNTLQKVLRECISRKTFIGTDITKSLKLSKPTVNECLEELSQNNFIENNGYINGEVGRKAKIWHTTLSNKISIAMEIDIKKIRIALIDMNGDISLLQEYSNILLTNNNFVDTIIEMLQNYIKTLPKNTFEDIEGIGIAIPGNVSFDRKEIIYITNLDIYNISCKKIEEKIQKVVFFENEANSATLGEFYLINNNSTDTSLFISISDYGVGGGHIVDGKLLKGSHRRSGEIGHLTLKMDGTPCSCGSCGCFERYTSNEALLQLIQDAHMPYSTIDELFESDTPESEMIIKQYCKDLGSGIKSLLIIFDATRLIIGGKITKFWDRIYPYLYQEVFYHNNFYKDKGEMLYPALNAEFSSLIGVGVINFFHHVYPDNIYK